MCRTVNVESRSVCRTPRLVPSRTARSIASHTRLSNRVRRERAHRGHTNHCRHRRSRRWRTPRPGCASSRPQAIGHADVPHDWMRGSRGVEHARARACAYARSAMVTPACRARSVHRIAVSLREVRRAASHSSDTYCSASKTTGGAATRPAPEPPDSEPGMVDVSGWGGRSVVGRWCGFVVSNVAPSHHRPALRESVARGKHRRRV